MEKNRLFKISLFQFLLIIGIIISSTVAFAGDEINSSIDIHENINININLNQIITINNISFIDENTNKVYDKILMNLRLNIQSLGDYKLNLIFVDDYNDIVINQKIKLKDLKIGQFNYIINLDINQVYESQIEGNLILKSIRLINSSSILLDSKINFFILRDINFFDFELLNLPDLIIDNINYNISNGELNLSISNIGKSDAVAFIIKIISNNSEILSEVIIDYLKSKNKINLLYNLNNNLSKIHIFLDYYNNIDEINDRNNHLSWPVLDSNFKFKDNKFISLLNSCPDLNYFELNWQIIYCDIYMNKSIYKIDNIGEISFKKKVNEKYFENISYKLNISNISNNLNDSNDSNNSNILIINNHKYNKIKNINVNYKQNKKNKKINKKNKSILLSESISFKLFRKINFIEGIYQINNNNNNKNFKIYLNEELIIDNLNKVNKNNLEKKMEKKRKKINKNNFTRIYLNGLYNLKLEYYNLNQKKINEIKFNLDKIFKKLNVKSIEN